jgi:L-lactate dehydrogenase complex protein LldG
MTESRDAILAGIRQALEGARPADTPEPPQQYRRVSDLPQTEILDKFIERLIDYRAGVRRVSQEDLADAVEHVCTVHGARKMVIPPGLPDSWLPSGIDFLRDESLSNSALDEADGVLTGCAVAIAETGTIVLDGSPDQGRRVITLLPDFHLCVLGSSQIVELVPEAFAVLQAAAIEGRALTFISGGSATSDIELQRVEGVHGPRNLEVLIVTDA